MDTTSYLMISQTLEIPLALGVTKPHKIWVCMNLIDHRAVGIALDKQEALDLMVENLEKIHSGEKEQKVRSN